MAESQTPTLTSESMSKFLSTPRPFPGGNTKKPDCFQILLYHNMTDISLLHGDRSLQPPRRWLPPSPESVKRSPLLWPEVFQTCREAKHNEASVPIGIPLFSSTICRSNGSIIPEITFHSFCSQVQASTSCICQWNQGNNCSNIELCKEHNGRLWQRYLFLGFIVEHWSCTYRSTVIVKSTCFSFSVTGKSLRTTWKGKHTQTYNQWHHERSIVIGFDKTQTIRLLCTPQLGQLNTRTIAKHKQ